MKVTIVVGLGYGDEGKGAVVDRLTRTSGTRLVVRSNGGAQAAHNVVAPDGTHHTFRQFGSGTLAGARTHLSRLVLVDPYELADEADALTRVGVADPWRLLTADQNAPVVTPCHIAANRLRELARGPAAHGTCGMGIGETAADLAERPELVIRVGDLAWPQATRRKLTALQELKRADLADAVGGLRGHPLAEPEIHALDDPDLPETVAGFYAWIAGRLRAVGPDRLGRLLYAAGHTVFEGAQGVLLDQDHGFHPHTTWTTTTTANARTLLAEAGFDGETTALGVLRAYAVRHGAGPMPTYGPALTAQLPEMHNRDDGWQGVFRCGWFDTVASRYAIEVSGGIDALAITCLDRLYGLADIRICTAYGYDGGISVRIPALDPGWQETAARTVSGAAPVYETPSPCPGVFGPDDVDPYLRAVEDVLGRPVALASAGPRATDTRTRALTAA